MLEESHAGGYWRLLSDYTVAVAANAFESVAN
jgi:hypothetical protein